MTPTEIARSLTKAQVKAFLTLPLPRVGKPLQGIPERSYGSIWRKSAKHWDALLDLEERSLVERRVSRGETLWRPTQGVGLAVRAALERMNDEQ